MHQPPTHTHTHTHTHTQHHHHNATTHPTLLLFQSVFPSEACSLIRLTSKAKVALADPDGHTLVETLFDWEVLTRRPGRKVLNDVVSCANVLLSPGSPVTLGGAARARAHIPLEARSYAFCYPSPCVDWSVMEEKGGGAVNPLVDTGDPVISLLLIGGFVYFDLAGAVCGINAVDFRPFHSVNNGDAAVNGGGGAGGGGGGDSGTFGGTGGIGGLYGSTTCVDSGGGDGGGRSVSAPARTGPGRVSGAGKLPPAPPSPSQRRRQNNKMIPRSFSKQDIASMEGGTEQASEREQKEGLMGDGAGAVGAVGAVGTWSGDASNTSVGGPPGPRGDVRVQSTTTTARAPTRAPTSERVKMLQFAPPRHLPSDAVRFLVERDRFRPTTLAVLLIKGARFVAWIKPGEALPGMLGARSPSRRGGERGGRGGARGRGRCTSDAGSVGSALSDASDTVSLDMAGTAGVSGSPLPLSLSTMASAPSGAFAYIFHDLDETPGADNVYFAVSGEEREKTMGGGGMGEQRGWAGSDDL